MNSKNKTFLALGVVAVLALTGCGTFDDATKHDAPEPTPSNVINGTNTQVIQMPDGYRNVSFTCYGHNGVYVTSRGAYQNGVNADGLPSSIFVVVNDEHCAAK